MSFRRGFKAEANGLVQEVRDELGLAVVDQLDPLALADLLDIPVLGLGTAGYASEIVTHFTRVEPRAFSAVTVFRGRRRVIVHNDAHAFGRQASNITHELAHALLLHAPTPAVDTRGCRYWNADVEDEANFLGGALLVTEEAALDIVRRRIPHRQAADRYGVSEAMIRWRINVTGAEKRVARAGRYTSRVLGP